MQTFYIASSMTNRPQVALLADYLRNRFRMSWALNHDWTPLEERDAPLGSPLRSRLAIMDLMAACAADLFVILRTDVISHGAHAEFGARLAVNRPVFLVQQNAPDHLFYSHPLVRRYQKLEELLAHLNNVIPSHSSSGRLPLPAD